MTFKSKTLKFIYIMKLFLLVLLILAKVSVVFAADIKDMDFLKGCWRTEHRYPKEYATYTEVKWISKEAHSLTGIFFYFVDGSLRATTEIEAKDQNDQLMFFLHVGSINHGPYLSRRIEKEKLLFISSKSNPQFASYIELAKVQKNIVSRISSNGTKYNSTEYLPISCE